MSGPRSAYDRAVDFVEQRDLLMVLLTVLVVYVLYTISLRGQGVPTVVSVLGQVTFLALSFAIVALALNLQWGYTGLFNIGVVAFMMVAVYAMAMVTRPPDPAFGPPGLGLPLPVGVLAGIVAASVLGLLAALPALRLRADYLAIVTLGLSEIVRLTIASSDFDDYLVETIGAGTGGATSLSIPVHPKLPVRELFYAEGRRASGTTPLGDAVFEVTGGYGIRETVVIDWAYVAILAVVLLATYLFLERLGRSPFGRILKAIREDELVANSLGKNVKLAKIKVFVLGCALMGVGGMLWYGTLGAANPQSLFYTPLYTFYIFIAVIVGGSGSNTGSVLGGVVFAAFLFEGPRRAARFVSERFVADVDAPNTFVGAVEPLASLDVEPFVAYTASEISALQFVFLGVVLIFIMHRRPEGLLGHRIETAAAVDLSDRSTTADGGEGGE